MARHKEVFDTGQIAHLWAHSPTTQKSARNPQGNFSFAATDLRSYSTTIARRFEHKGQTVFLLTTATYSNTTNGHQSLARQAVHGDNVFTVPNIDPHNYAEHKANVLDLLNRAAESAGKSVRARKSYSIQSYAGTAARLIQSASRYATLFNVRGIKFPSTEDIAAIGRAAAEATAKARKEESAKQAKARKEREAREATLAAALPGLAREWREGQDHPIGPFGYVNEHRLGGDTHLMRLVKGEDGEPDKIETNLYASVPARHVRRIAPFILNLMTKCGDSVDPVYATARFPGKTLHVGSFAVTWWNKNKVCVGCHVFGRAEVELTLDTLRRAEIVPSEEETVTENNAQ